MSTDDTTTPPPETPPAAEAEATPKAAGSGLFGKRKPTLRDQVADLERKLAESQDRYLRTRAEFDNYRKRMQRDLSDARQFARIDTLETLLPVLDHFQMAMAYANQSPDYQTLKQGMDMILNEFERSWESLGVQRIVTVGKPVDPTCHEVVSTEASATVPEGTVLRETKSGYLVGERLLRAAGVVASSGPQAEPEAASSTDEK